jgi:hypothetical protein
MAAGPTYEPIATTTASGSVSQITFTSISGAYTDLIVIVNGYANYGFADRTTLALRVGNGSLDTSSVYSNTSFYGNGTTPNSNRGSAQSYIFTGVISEKSGTTTIHLQNYSNTATFKTVLTRGNSLGSTAAQDIGVTAGLWRSTSAINTVQIYVADGTNFGSGSTVTLYGIAAA